MFGIKRRFQRCKVRLPRFKESSVRVHQIWVPPSKRAVSPIVVQSSKRTVAYRHRLAAYHNKHCWRAFQGYQHWWPWTTLNPQNMDFKWIFRHFRQERSDGGISVYIPPNQSTLNFFMWLFCLLDPFIPTQIKFLAMPLILGCDAHLNFRWNILEIAQDNLRTKLNWCCRASHEH